MRQLYAVDDYKSKSRDARAGYVVDRFEATESLSGEVVLLIDDVVTTGSQANACRDVLNSAGAGQITIAAAAVTQDSLADPCPRCGADWGGTVRVRRRRRDSVEFRACSRYPNCTWTANL